VCRRILPTAFDLRSPNLSYPRSRIQPERALLPQGPSAGRGYRFSDQGECRRRVSDKSRRTERTGPAGKARTWIRSGM